MSGDIRQLELDFGPEHRKPQDGVGEVLAVIERKTKRELQPTLEALERSELRKRQSQLKG